MNPLKDPMFWANVLNTLPGVVNLLILLLTILVTWGITKGTTDSRWKYIMKYHMDDYTKAERAKDLEEIKDLTKDLATLTAELEQLRRFRRGILALSEPQRKESNCQTTRTSTLKVL